MTASTYVQRTATITIASDNDLSDAVPTNNGNLVMLKMPAGFDAGNLGFQGSLDGTNFGGLIYVTGADVIVTGPAVNEIVTFKQTVALQGLTHIKVSTSVAQTADRAFTLVFEE